MESGPRDDLTVTHVKSLQSGLSTGSFAKLDSWVKVTFKNQQTGVLKPGSGPYTANAKSTRGPLTDWELRWARDE